MIHLPASVRVYLCLSPCDMRRSFDGLHALVRDHLQLDAFAGHLYLFANRRKDRLKIFILGPQRIRDLGETLRSWRVHDPLRRAQIPGGWISRWKSGEHC
jgi:transposase